MLCTPVAACFLFATHHLFQQHLPLQELLKKAKRAERFGGGPAEGDEEADKRAKRAARFDASAATS